MIDIPQTGEWFEGHSISIKDKLTAVADRLFEYNCQLKRSQEKEKEIILKEIFKSTKEKVTILSPFNCDFGNISVGENFFANYNLTILDEAEVIFGDNAFIGPNVSIYTIIHHYDPILRNKGIMKALPVIIGNNVWIGGNVIIMPGVTIGDNCVIGAGSIVTKDIPSNTMAFGNPCKVVKEI
ncbi:MAG: sugar O-acetyltransferase [Bacteroidales bacterium]|nr:sugar O-acetyltransferase [Bacteroidales bacterium]